MLGLLADDDFHLDKGALALFVLAFLSVYLLPTWIAFARHHRNRFPIFIVNLLCGWMLVGWVVAMAWSASAKPAVEIEMRERRRRRHDSESRRSSERYR